jgi:hypothetical protein
MTKFSTRKRQVAIKKVWSWWQERIQAERAVPRANDVSGFNPRGNFKVGRRRPQAAVPGAGASRDKVKEPGMRVDLVSRMVEFIIIKITINVRKYRYTL